MTSPRVKRFPLWLLPVGIVGAVIVCIGLVCGFIKFADWVFE